MGAVTERTLANGSNAIGDGDRGDVFAPRERIVTNGSNAIGNGDRGEVFAA